VREGKGRRWEQRCSIRRRSEAKKVRVKTHVDDKKRKEGCKVQDQKGGLGVRQRIVVVAASRELHKHSGKCRGGEG